MGRLGGALLCGNKGSGRAIVGRVEVKGIRWLGVGTQRVSLMRSFAIDVLGLRVVGEDTEHFVELAMGDGTKPEFFGSAATADSPWLFESIRSSPAS
jgi:hypothetical protein